MPRTTRIRRAPNREPASLAGVATLSSENEVIDTIETLPPGTDIDSALTAYDLHPPPPPPTQIHDSSDPYDTLYPIANFEYPSPSPAIPNERHSRELSWPPTPPRPSTLLQAQPPLPLPLPPTISDILSQLPFRWTFEMEEILFFTLLEQVDIGKRADSRFKKEAWIACCNAVTDATGQLITVEKCKNKMEAMKASWRELNWLREQSGFGWNENTGLVQAGDQAWKDIIKVSDTIDILLLLLAYVYSR
jgi:hypothetical protein